MIAFVLFAAFLGCRVIAPGTFTQLDPHNLAEQPLSFTIDLPIRYHNSEYDLTFLLPRSWQGYSVLIQHWDGEIYSPATDKTNFARRGPLITLRHPRWQPGAPLQDIPIVIFTRAQWDALHHGKLWPSLFAGGCFDEVWHNRKYVFAMSSRYNWNEFERWQEVAEIVQRNRAANKMRRLYSE